MFGWFKKQPDPKTEAAYKKGEELGAKVAEDIENWLSNGLGPYRSYMLKTLQESLAGYRDVREIPPGYFVRENLAAFYEAVSDRRPEVKQRTFAALNEWLEVGDVMEMRKEFEALIDKRLNDFDAALRIEALEVMQNSVPLLVEADNLWRAANPELSRRYPPPEDPNFKDDGRQVLPF